MDDRILTIMRDIFEDEAIDTTCSQGNCEKWDSMGHLRLVVELESEFEVTLEPEEIGEMVSYEDIIRILKSKVSVC